MVFTSRATAGRHLAQKLQDEGAEPDLVLGLPRGGVVVAAEVACTLRKPLDVLIVRKLGHPLNREFAVGALAEPDVVILDNTSLRRFPATQREMEAIIAEETERLQQYRARFHQDAPSNLINRDVLLVDDGIATGATTEAAVLSARKQGARQVIVAAPVASANAVERLTRCADRVVALRVDPYFGAVGQYYAQFPQTSDEEVLALLHFKKAA